MTGREIYSRASAYLMEGAGDDPAFSECALELINAHIAECIPCQNSRNIAQGKAKIKSAAIKSLDDTVALDEPLCEIALPYALAADFFRDELDYQRSDEFNLRFLDALDALSKISFSQIEDAYL